MSEVRLPALILRCALVLHQRGGVLLLEPRIPHSVRDLGSGYAAEPSFLPLIADLYHVFLPLGHEVIHESTRAESILVEHNEQATSPGKGKLVHLKVLQASRLTWLWPESEEEVVLPRVAIVLYGR